MYVGGNGLDNYSRIQDAIDNSSKGYTIFVYDLSSPYFENIVINKTINLTGENKNSTIIDGNSVGDVIFITANSVNITGFKVQNSGNIDRDAGIKIQSRSNKIFCNIITNNDEGIGISSTSYNIISGNIISNNDYGIRIFTGSKYNLIIDNIISSNKFRGIRFEGSDNNILCNNTIKDNGNAVRFEDSNNNNFSSNQISNNGIGLDIISSINTTLIGNDFINDGIQLEDSYQNHLSNNIVNGKPIIYLEEESNKTIDEAGQILLVNCNNITIQNQIISNVTYGILLWQTNDCLIKENILYSNDFDGILLHSSSNNIITSNKISINDNGISLDYSGTNNKIFDNEISDNAHGIHIISSISNTNISNNNISNNLYGVQLYDSHDTIVTKNNISNSYFGISLWQLSSNNFIFSNKIQNCENGIWLNNVNDNRVIKNTIIKCETDGIWLLKSIHNKISENLVIYSKCSVELADSNFNIITENIFEKGGIFLSFSHHNTVTDNFVNNKSLVYLEDKKDLIVEEAGQVIVINCERITIQNNEFFDLIVGVLIWESNFCQINNNTFFNNYYGSWLMHSSNNSFQGNEITNYADLGLYLFLSNDNILSENSIFLYENKEDNVSFIYEKNKCFSPIPLNDLNNYSKAIFIQGSEGNVIVNNNISNNKNGIVLEVSCKNIIERNKIKLNENFGILITNSCENNEIIRNSIIKNADFGIYLDESSSNKIKNNNFIENNNSAFFKHSFLNRWVKNYWDSFRILPKIIFGKIKIGSRSIKWINIDLRPAKIPINF